MARRLYLRPTAFVDAPFGCVGQALRLAGGLCWFSAVELILVDQGRRVESRHVPVAQLEGAIDELGALAEAARATLARLTAPRTPISLGARTIRLDQPQVMAILNVTPDSFSDGGLRDGDAAKAMADGVAMAEQGAAIVDVGGESTRPGAQPVCEGDEAARVLPVIERLISAGMAVSVDTRKAAVMRAALAQGPVLINDVSALGWDAQAMDVVAGAGCPVVLMHAQGEPQTMQHDPRYDDVLIEVYDWLAARVAAAEAAGIARDRIIVDPGIGFGKTLSHNLALLNGLSIFHGLGCALLLGASRKRMIGALDHEAPADRRMPGSLVLAIEGARQGAQLLRVHDVAETVQALRVWRGLRDAALAALA